MGTLDWPLLYTPQVKTSDSHDPSCLEYGCLFVHEVTLSLLHFPPNAEPNSWGAVLGRQSKEQPDGNASIQLPCLQGCCAIGIHRTSGMLLAVCLFTGGMRLAVYPTGFILCLQVHTHAWRYVPSLLPSYHVSAGGCESHSCIWLLPHEWWLVLVNVINKSYIASAELQYVTPGSQLPTIGIVC